MLPDQCLVLEEGADVEQTKKWDVFWEYFAKQWITIAVSWNIINKNGKTLEVRNHTNNVKW